MVAPHPVYRPKRRKRARLPQWLVEVGGAALMAVLVWMFVVALICLAPTP